MLARGVYEAPATDNGRALPRPGSLGGRGDLPAFLRPRDRRLAAIHCARPDLRHRLLDERTRRLRRPVRVVDAGLPAVVIGFVGDVEDQEAAYRGLTSGELERVPVVRRLHALADGFRRGRLRRADE